VITSEKEIAFDKQLEVNQGIKVSLKPDEYTKLSFLNSIKAVS
jgi:hypothetical protein